MGASRESRPSEKQFERVISDVRSIDKLLWLGNAGVANDIEEYISIIKYDLDETIRLFRAESKLPEVPPPATFVPNTNPPMSFLPMDAPPTG